MFSERLLFDSPLLRIGHFVCPAEEPEWTTENVIRGTAAVFPTVPVLIQQAGHEAVVADRNVVMFYNEGQPYRRGLLHRRGDDAIWIAMQGALAAELVGEHDPEARDHPESPFRRSHGPSPAACYLRHRALAEYLMREDAPDQLRVEEAALGLLRELIDADAALHRRGGREVREETTRSRREIAEEVRRLLALDPGFAWSLDELVERVYVSPSHLCRLFKEQVGLTIHQYLSQLRLREAASAVLDGERDLTGLALRLGYSTHSHFTDAFGRAFGMPPRRLRQRGEVDRLALAVA